MDNNSLVIVVALVTCSRVYHTFVRRTRVYIGGLFYSWGQPFQLKWLKQQVGGYISLPYLRAVIQVAVHDFTAQQVTYTTAHFEKSARNDPKMTLNTTYKVKDNLI